MLSKKLITQLIGSSFVNGYFFHIKTVRGTKNILNFNHNKKICILEFFHFITVITILKM